jgi:hypothetical protein
MGTATRNTRESFQLILNVMMKAKIIIRGARTQIRMIIWNAVCTLVTSVVSRVTRPDVEYLSIFENEKSCML